MNTKFETKILENGMTVKTLQNNHLHSVNLGVYVNKIPESVCGIAHMVEHMFFRSLGDIPQEKLYYEMDKIGATINAATYSDFVCFDITVAPSKIKEAFNLISRIFSKSEWNTADILAEKEVVKRQIEERYNSLYSKTDLAYYDGTPKGSLLMGKISDINKMSARKINEYREMMFIPENACFVMTGNFVNEDLTYCIEGLSKISCKAIENSLTKDYSIKEFSQRTEDSDKIYSSKDGFSDVCISFDVDEKKINRYAAEYLFNVLGFGVTSRLSQKLREQEGLISDINGGIEFTDYSGRMTFEYEVKNIDLVDSLLSVFNVLAEEKNNLSQADIESNIIFYSENQYRLLDNVRELNFLIGWRGFIVNEKIESMEDLIDRYRNITVDEINQASNEILTSKNLTISVSNNNQRFSKEELKILLRSCREKLEVN